MGGPYITDDRLKYRNLSFVFLNPILLLSQGLHLKSLFKPGLCFPPTRLTTGAQSTFYTVNLKPAFPCKPINLSNNLPHRSLIPMQGHLDLEIVNEFIIAQQTGCLRTPEFSLPPNDSLHLIIHVVFKNLPKLPEEGSTDQIRLKYL